MFQPKAFRRPLLVASVLLLAIGVYFFFFRSSGVYDAVPDSAVAIVEANNWSQLNTELGNTATGVELKKTEAVQKLLNGIMLMQELLDGDKSLKVEIVSAKTVASLHITSATDYDFLFTTNLPGVNDNTLLNHIQVSPLVRSISVRIYRSQKIVAVKLKDGKQLSFAKRGSILAFSLTTFLTENSVSASITGNNLKRDKNFKAVQLNGLNKSGFSLYFNYSRAAVVFPIVLKQERSSLLEDAIQNGWGRYEVSCSNTQLELDGVISSANESESEKETQLDKSLADVIADHAAYVSISRTDTGGNPLLKKYFESWMGDTKAFVVAEPLKEDFTGQNIFLLTTKNKQIAIENLKQLIAASNGTTALVDTFLNFEIYHLPDGNVINELFGNSFVKFEEPFFTIVKNTVMFCNNIDVLKLQIEKIGRGETLAQEENFGGTNFSRFSMNSSVQYLNFERSDLLLRGMLQESSNAKSFFSNFKTALIVSNHKGKETISRITLVSGGAPPASAGLLWKTKLQTASTFAPQIVLNNSTGEKEIFVQDTSNNVYLLSSSGQILFTKNIGEPILDKIHQIDYYNNGKLQLIFNSAHHVFIVDRLGNDIGSYPLRLAGTATCGMTFYNDRYYIPCSNGSIYGYEATGKPLVGWSPRSSVGFIYEPVLAFNSGKIDFVLALNNAGKLLLLDGRGNIKWDIDNLPLVKQDFSFVRVKEGFKLLNASANLLIEISIDGTKNIQELIDTATAFTAMNVSDTSYNYYFSTGNQLRSYDNNNEFKNAVSVSAPTVTSLEVLNFYGQNYLLAADEISKQFFIYNTSLKPVTLFSYSNSYSYAVSDLLNRNELAAITCDTVENISCYRIGKETANHGK